jgi:hypothetical protein
VTHIRHDGGIRYGNSQGTHAWCGLRIDIRPWITVEDAHVRSGRGLDRNVCGNCKAALKRGTARAVTGQ